MILEEHDLDAEDKATLGLTLQPKESNLDEEALEWIETAAYYIWVDEGCPEGEHLTHWDKAARLFRDSQDR